MNKILSSTKFVVENSSDVSIDHKAIAKFCESKPKIRKESWFQDAPFSVTKLKEKEQIHFMFLFAALGFCFWGNPKWSVKYNDKTFDGAWGLIASLARAIENGHDLLDFVNLIGISANELSFIFAGNGDIPLFEERLEILREVSSVAVNTYSNDIRNLVRDSEIDVFKFQKEIVKHFPSFDDKSVFRGKTVIYNKRAQIFISTLYQMYGGQKFGSFFNIEELTALADYKLPLVLQSLEILKYSPKLQKIIDNKNIIERDSEYENEIRSNTIWALEYIRQEFESQGLKFLTIDINDYIWTLGQKKSKAPYHQTITTAY